MYSNTMGIPINGTYTCIDSYMYVLGYKFKVSFYVFIILLLSTLPVRHWRAFTKGTAYI